MLNCFAVFCKTKNVIHCDVLHFKNRDKSIFLCAFYFRTSATELESASKDIENSKAKDAELRQLERDKALLVHKQQETQRKVDQESDKRKKVTLTKFCWF